MIDQLTDEQKQIRSIGGEGILTDSDLPELSKAERRIADLLNDGKWHTATEIIEVSGQREGLRRLRQLRVYGMEIERRREPNSREFSYRSINVRN